MAQKTLGEVADYINGRAFKPDEWEDDGLPIIRIQNLTGSTDITSAGKDRKGRAEEEVGNGREMML